MQTIFISCVGVKFHRKWNKQQSHAKQTKVLWNRTMKTFILRPKIQRAVIEKESDTFTNYRWHEPVCHNIDGNQFIAFILNWIRRGWLWLCCLIRYDQVTQRFLVQSSLMMAISIYQNSPNHNSNRVSLLRFSSGGNSHDLVRTFLLFRKWRSACVTLYPFEYELFWGKNKIFESSDKISVVGWSRYKSYGRKYPCLPFSLTKPFVFYVICRRIPMQNV